MGEIQTTLQSRFPLLTSLRLFGPSGSEDLAAFMGVLLSTMDAKNDGSFCFVFPRKAGVAPLSAVLYALGRFAVDFPALAEKYARSGFTDGQHVRLVPSDKVFVFGGLWQGFQTSFRLRLLEDKHRTSFTWPVSDILRIEPTTYKRPKGREADIVAAKTKPPLSTLDRLIGTRTCGNPSLAVNHVLYLGGRSEMEEFFCETTLGNATGAERASLAELILPGDIGQSGEIRHPDQHQAAGEPLIAISSRIDYIAAACESAPAQSKVVVVDAARRITDLASFDRIAASQNLIIVAETDEEEKLRQLHDRGCRLWRFSLSDLEIGTQSESGSFFRGVFQSARNEATLSIDTVACRNIDLEEAASALEYCQKTLTESDSDETQRVLRQIYGLLLRCAGFLRPPTDSDRAELIAIAATLSAAAADRLMWLPEPSAEALKKACGAIARAISQPDLGTAKGEAARSLLGEIKDHKAGSVALVSRSAFAKQYLAAWLQNHGFSFPVLLGNAIAAGDFYERLICVSWPNAANFRKLVRSYAAPRATLLGYPFEAGWLHDFRQREHRSAALPYLTATDKSAVLRLSANVSWPADPLAQNGSSPETSGFDFEESISRKGVIPVAAIGEETTPATLVSFVGDAYALLTETYKVPVITDLLSGAAGLTAKIPRRRLAELQTGDVLVFRERGRRDVIQALADAALGKDAPAIRGQAARWHDALRRSELGEERLLVELKQVNCPRTLQTVRGWLNDDSMIGPQSKDDLEAIAYAVGDQKLLEDVPAIWAAIHTLRGEHLSAGMRLSRILLEKLPGKLHELAEGRTRIEIDTTTSAWIVQIEHIAASPELRPWSYVNALLWDTDDSEGSESWAA